MYVFEQWIIIRLQEVLPVLLLHVQNVHWEAQQIENQIVMHVVSMTKKIFSIHMDFNISNLLNFLSTIYYLLSLKEWNINLPID